MVIVIDNNFLFHRKVKHSQMIAGVDWYTFWFSTFVWDMITYILPVLLTVALYTVLQVPNFSGIKS